MVKHKVKENITFVKRKQVNEQTREFQGSNRNSGKARGRERSVNESQRGGGEREKEGELQKEKK